MSAARNLVAFQTITQKEITRFLRIWIQTILPPAITMALYFVIFGHFIGARVGKVEGFSYIMYIAPGLIMMSVITNAYANVCSSFFAAKFQRSVEEMLVSPIPNHVILLGYMAGGVMRGLAVGIVVMLVALVFTHLPIHHIFLTLLIVILAAALFSLAGFINAVFAKKFDDVSIVPTFILTPLTYLGGVFYSINLLPNFWHQLSLANPILYMVNAFRFGMLGISDINIEFAVLMIGIVTVILYFIAYWLLQKGIGVRN